MAAAGPTREGENFTELRGVHKLECTDKKRFLDCEVEQRVENNEFEGGFKAQDVVIEDGDMDKFSTSANEFSISMKDARCRLYDEGNVLRCRRK